MQHPEPLPLSGEQVVTLAEGWDDSGLWQDVLWLAARLWTTRPEERTVPWHHLALAVGNFKRQAGRRLNPAKLSQEPAIVEAGETLDLRAVDGLPAPIVERDQPRSWGAISDLHGFGFATTTTLLAAIWPEHHLIADWRVRAATIGLLVHEGAHPLDVDADSSTNPAEELDPLYVYVRATCLATAARTGCSLVQVERALYELSRKISNDDGRTWGQYGQLLAGALP